MSSASVADLIGEDLREDPLGQDMAGDLIAGYIPDRSLVHVPQAQIGDGLAGPPNDQSLQIWRDTRPLAVDELGMQGPFTGEKVARHRAGRTFPLNYTFGAGIDPEGQERVPEQEVLAPSPFSAGWQDGVPAAEILPTTHTVYYTASPNVGWDGY